MEEIPWAEEVEADKKPIELSQEEWKKILAKEKKFRFPDQPPYPKGIEDDDGRQQAA